MILSLLQRFQRRYMPLQHDPMHSPAERYYGRIYGSLITDHLARGASPAQTILDLGCGVGRLLIPLACAGHVMVGVEAHHDSLRRLRENLAAARAAATIIERDLLDALPQFSDAAFDAVMAIEVLYVNPDPERILRELGRVVRPRGLVFATHRTPFYYLSRALQHGHYDDASLISRTMQEPRGFGAEAALRKGMHRIRYNWQFPDRLRGLYSAAGLNLIGRYAIGPCSGFGPDPFARICNPDTLTPDELEVLHEVEKECGDDGLTTARYVLAVAQRPAA